MSSPSRIISDVELQRKFNDGGYLRRWELGELEDVVIEENHPSSPLAKEPFCTRSQMIALRVPSSQRVVARVHRYLRPDGTIGLSGLPDPKGLLDRGVWFELEVR